MEIKSNTSRRIGWTLTGLLAATLALAAQEAPVAVSTEALTARIQALEAELAELKRLVIQQQAAQQQQQQQPTPSQTAVEELDQKVRIMERRQEIEKEEAAARAKSTPVLSVGPGGFIMRSADSNFVLRVRGGVQADTRVYGGGSPGNDTFLIRRARPGLEGTVFGKFDYRLMLELGSGTSSSAANNGYLLDAYADAHLLPWLSLRAGKFKEPVGLERLQSYNNLLFLERGYPTQLVPNRDTGVMLHGNLWDGVLQYQFGVFNGTADGGSSDFDTADGDKDFAGRIFAHPFRHSEAEWIRGLGIGVAGTIGEHSDTPRSYSSPGAQRFFSYRSGSGDNPNVVADGTLWRISPQAYYYWGPFGIFAEYVISSQTLLQAGGGPTAGQRGEVQNQAWQVAASYFLTGEANSFRAVTPRNPVTFGSDSKWGAWEVAARVGGIHVDDDAFPIFADPATAAGEALSWGFGLNWHLNRNVKLQLNYEHTRFNGGDASPVAGRDEDLFSSRLQLAF